MVGDMERGNADLFSQLRSPGRCSALETTDPQHTPLTSAQNQSQAHIHGLIYGPSRLKRVWNKMGCSLWRALWDLSIIHPPSALFSSSQLIGFTATLTAVWVSPLSFFSADIFCCFHSGEENRELTTSEVGLFSFELQHYSFVFLKIVLSHDSTLNEWMKRELKITKSHILYCFW